MIMVLWEEVIVDRVEHLPLVLLWVWLFTSICVGCKKKQTGDRRCRISGRYGKGRHLLWKMYLYLGSLLAGLRGKKSIVKDARRASWSVDWSGREGTLVGGPYPVLLLLIRFPAVLGSRNWLLTSTYGGLVKGEESSREHGHRESCQRQHDSWIGGTRSLVLVLWELFFV